PVCAMYLATLGKRALVRREMYGNLLLTIGGTIQQIIENLQLAADERLIEPLWRMQVLVDRANRAQTDEEMDRFEDLLLQALGELRTLRDRLQGDQFQGDQPGGSWSGQGRRSGALEHGSSGAASDREAVPVSPVGGLASPLPWVAADDVPGNRGDGGHAGT